MKLTDAIQHLKESLTDPTHKWGCEECKQEHEQLLVWLEDYKRLRGESSWIPCSERLPEVREKVLALYDYCTCEVRQQYIMIASLAPDGYWMEGCTWHPPQSVTHWMSLPQSPKEVHHDEN